MRIIEYKKNDVKRRLFNYPFARCMRGNEFAVCQLGVSEHEDNSRLGCREKPFAPAFAIIYSPHMGTYSQTENHVRGPDAALRVYIMLAITNVVLYARMRAIDVELWLSNRSGTMRSTKVPVFAVTRALSFPLMAS